MIEEKKGRYIELLKEVQQLIEEESPFLDIQEDAKTIDRLFNSLDGKTKKIVNEILRLKVALIIPTWNDLQIATEILRRLGSRKVFINFRGETKEGKEIKSESEITIVYSEE